MLQEILSETAIQSQIISYSFPRPRTGFRMGSFAPKGKQPRVRKDTDRCVAAGEVSARYLNAPVVPPPRRRRAAGSGRGPYRWWASGVEVIRPSS